MEGLLYVLYVCIDSDANTEALVAIHNECPLIIREKRLCSWMLLSMYPCYTLAAERNSMA